MVVTVMGSTVQKKGGWHVGHIKFTELKLKRITTMLLRLTSLHYYSILMNLVLRSREKRRRDYIGINA